MTIDGFTLKIHSVLGFAILLVVFWAAYKIGQSKYLDQVPFFRSAGS